MCFLALKLQFRLQLHGNEFRTHSVHLNFDYGCEMYMYIYKEDLLNPPKSQRKIIFLLALLIKEALFFIVIYIFQYNLGFWSHSLIE